MKKKGFTLTEILAVITILGVIVALVIPSVMNSITKTKAESYLHTIETVENVARLYVSDYREEIPDINVIGSNVSITLQELVDKGMVKAPVMDARTNTAIPLSTTVLIHVIEKNKFYINFEYSDNIGRGDFIAPVITVTLPNPAFVNQGQTYTDLGATALDNIDGNVSYKIMATSNVNVNVPGNYTVTYTVMDRGGNVGTATRTVTVVDTVAPVITFNPTGNTTYARSRSVTTTVTDAGIINGSTLKYQWNTSATPPAEGTFSTTFTNGSVISSTPGITGSYYLWAMAKDMAGNTTISKTNIFNLDNNIPVITITGSNPVSVNVGTSYTDAGATATDNIDGNLTSSITANSNVNVNLLGSYTVTYSVTDSSGNTVTANRTVNVIDTVNPVVSFGTNGNATYAKTRSTTVTVTDNVAVNTSTLEYQWTTSTTAPTEASFTTTFTNGGTISSPGGVTGGYYLWILAKDTSANTAITRTNVFNLDNTIPVITRTGSSPVTVDVGTVYTDAGATASDNIDGNITASISIGSNVNSNLLGSYTVTYNVSDSSGNVATQVTRTVNVIDTVDPVISFGTNGNATYAKTRSTTVTVTDNVAVNTSTLEYQWTTSTTEPTEASFTTTFTNGGTISSPGGVTGGYYLWILAKDTSANTAIIRTNVFNLDNTIPVITRTGSSPVTVEVGTTYTDAGATASDNINGNITASISTGNNVNSNVVGSYTVTYNVSDSSGNAATQVTRTVNVVDTTAPTISTALAGTMLYTDPTFNSGVNGTGVYNNLGNGNVTVTRTAISGAPVGSGNGLTITTNGTATPGLGGFYFATPTAASKVFVTRIVAKIPVGYTINWASNAYGGGTFSWLTSQAGTGDWEEYMCRVNVGTNGSYGTTNYYYLTGTSPVTWYVAYATVFDTTKWGTSNNIAITATDAGTGINGYGFNQSSVTPPTFTNVTATSSFATSTSNITTNGTYYVWMRDVSNNTSNVAVIVSYVDTTAPSVATVNLNGYTSNTWATGNITQTFSSTDSGSGIQDYQYSDNGGSTWADVPANPWVISSDGTWTRIIRAIDNAGNVGSASASYIAKRDATPPAIATVNLNGYASGSWTNGSITQTFSSSDATSGIQKYQYSDNAGSSWADVPASPWVVSSNGSWTRIIRAVDNAGLPGAASSSYTINRNNVPPVITVTGSNPINVGQGDAYTDAGATATDDISGNITASITSTSTVNTATPGTYTVTYNVTDNAGNTDSATRTVNVIQTYNYAYTGGSQLFTAPVTGVYKVELWGAQGNYSGTYAVGAAGKGGYTKGNITLNEGEQYYVFVGGGGDSSVSGGYNGGGHSGTLGTHAGGGGGGATAFAIRPTQYYRYVRDYANGSTSNSYSHWVEIEANATFRANQVVGGVLVGGSYSGTFAANTDTSGAVNAGEVRVTTGTFTYPDGTTFADIDGTTKEIQTDFEGATVYGNCFIMFTGTNYSRFTDYNGNTSHMFRAVKYEGTTWYYNTNSGWASFTPNAGDRLIGYLTKTQADTDITSASIGASSFTFNLALGKSVPTYSSAGQASYPYTRITDGNLDSAVYAAASTYGSLQYVEVDLGAEFPLIDVRIFHYYTDGRSYNATKTVLYNAAKTVSNTIFDVGSLGPYDETSAGRRYNTNYKERIMVAAGGGGAASSAQGYPYGGGLTGGNSVATGYEAYGGNGASQTAGGAKPSQYASTGDGLTGGFFGIGGDGNASSANGWGAGGGGGYYGGSGGSGAGTGSWGGGGGSSFISGHTGCNAITSAGAASGQPNHYSGKVFTSTQMIAGNASMPIPAGGTETGHTGDGYARISFVQ